MDPAFHCAHQSPGNNNPPPLLQDKYGSLNAAAANADKTIADLEALLASLHPPAYYDTPPQGPSAADEQQSQQPSPELDSWLLDGPHARMVAAAEDIVDSMAAASEPEFEELPQSEPEEEAAAKAASAPVATTLNRRCSVVNFGGVGLSLAVGVHCGAGRG